MAAKTSKQLKVDEKRQMAKIAKLTNDLKKEKENLAKLKQKIKTVAAAEKAKEAKIKAAKKSAKKSVKKSAKKATKKSVKK
ncbi:MAG: hypothetical protein PF637_06855 [Spirochaetes bacterium]|jgi:hypothetical protein|nr:hypothetical protein [Spirochaetota bacterium]